MASQRTRYFSKQLKGAKHLKEWKLTIAWFDMDITKYEEKHVYTVIAPVQQLSGTGKNIYKEFVKELGQMSSY